MVSVEIGNQSSRGTTVSIYRNRYLYLSLYTPYLPLYSYTLPTLYRIRYKELFLPTLILLFIVRLTLKLRYTI